MSNSKVENNKYDCDYNDTSVGALFALWLIPFDSGNSK